MPSKNNRSITITAKLHAKLKRAASKRKESKPMSIPGVIERAVDELEKNK